MVTMRIVPVRIARARLGQPEVGAHRGRGDGRVVSAVCGSPPESFALCSIKGEEQTRKRCGFGQHQTLLCSCSKCSRVSTFTLAGVLSSPASFTSVPVCSRADTGDREGPMHRLSASETSIFDRTLVGVQIGATKDIHCLSLIQKFKSLY